MAEYRCMKCGERLGGDNLAPGETAVCPSCRRANPVPDIRRRRKMYIALAVAGAVVIGVGVVILIFLLAT